jgi:ATP-dependent HslUV protease ATP-binding subunit HslU
MERLLEQASYDAADKDGTTIDVTAEFVDRHLGALAKDEDLSRYIL